MNRVFTLKVFGKRYSVGIELDHASVSDEQYDELFRSDTTKARSKTKSRSSKKRNLSGLNGASRTSNINTQKSAVL